MPCPSWCILVVMLCACSGVLPNICLSTFTTNSIVVMLSFRNITSYIPGSSSLIFSLVSVCISVIVIPYYSISNTIVNLEGVFYHPIHFMLYLMSISLAFLCSRIILSMLTLSKPSLSSAPLTSTSLAIVNVLVNILFDMPLCCNPSSYFSTSSAGSLLAFDFTVSKFSLYSTMMSSLPNPASASSTS